MNAQDEWTSGTKGDTNKWTWWPYSTTKWNEEIPSREIYIESSSFSGTKGIFLLTMPKWVQWFETSGSTSFNPNVHVILVFIVHHLYFDHFLVFVCFLTSITFQSNSLVFVLIFLASCRYPRLDCPLPTLTTLITL